MGSMAEARRAGRWPAIVATTERTTTIARNVRGSPRRDLEQQAFERPGGSTMPPPR